ncbi:PUA domain-containing protein [Halovenus rubra]|uniref:PUA domain-containing protein n=2 Tax=Halovenus rubra TaxID=869890 RepID=A0ABD5XCW8_9EURY|nr:PUA domain-containing protein [Halovenus rubra]
MTADLADLRTIARYQFGDDAAEALFPTDEPLDVTRTTSGRPRQIHAEAGRIATYERDGRFRLGIEGGRRLNNALPDTSYRVVVGEESDPFVREGRNAFAKFVQHADKTIRPRDEVLVTRDDGTLLGVGRAELAGEGMLAFETGMAVKMRDGVES